VVVVVVVVVVVAVGGILDTATYKEIIFS
jgi:hypothetical protein